MKKSILLFVLVTLFTCSFATNPVVTVNEAKQTAANFLNEQCYINAKSIHLTLQQMVTDDNGEPLYYRFQLNDQGFVLVSASKNYYPILAFSYESNFEDSEEGSAFCNSYKKNIQAVKEAKAPVNASVSKAWNHFNRENFTKAKDVDVNECQPLLTTHWGQTKYYNQYCPFDGNANVNTKDYRTTVGSAALAMASIINYYRYPTQGRGGVSYISSLDWGAYQEIYPRFFLNLNNVTYDYDAMPSAITNYNGEVAKLLFHTGATALTRYSAERSNSNRTKTSPTEAYNAMKQYWGYSNDAQMIFRPTDIQNDSIWIADYILSELDERRPVFYSAYKESTLQTHMCMVIDGYKYMTVSQGNVVFLHVNLNSTVNANEMKKAYYMYTSNNFSYKYGESVCRFLQPATLNIEKPVTSEKVITSRTGAISDGAGNMKYASNSNRSWLFAVPNATSYKFTFKRLDMVDSNDVVSIYKGSEVISDSLVNSFTGQHLTAAATDNTEGSQQQVTYDLPALPNQLTVYSDKVLVTFTSNDTIEDYGFVLEYSCTYDQSDIPSCGETQNLTNYHYIIVDKYQSVIQDTSAEAGNINSITSADEPYAADTICSWLVRTPGAVGYYFNFPKFDLRAGDFVELTTIGNTPELLYKFDIFNWPTESGYNVDASKMKVRFVTDHWQEGNGFELEYWTVLGINQESGLSDINIYPNPATNFVNVEFTAEAQNINVKMVDMSGKVIYSDVFSHGGGTQIYKVPVSDLASGIYFMHLNTPTGNSIQKVVVR